VYGLSLAADLQSFLITLRAKLLGLKYCLQAFRANESIADTVEKKGQSCLNYRNYLGLGYIDTIIFGYIAAINTTITTLNVVGIIINYKTIIVFRDI